MSTRALYTFKGDSSWNVYKHHDGYPTGAADVLQDTLKFAWTLPRYEADEFATAFIAAAKSEGGGGVRMMPQGDPRIVASENCSDIEYRYEIYQGNGGELRVQAYSVEAWGGYDEELIADCKLSQFANWAKREAA